MYKYIETACYTNIHTHTHTLYKIKMKSKCKKDDISFIVSPTHLCKSLVSDCHSGPNWVLAEVTTECHILCLQLEDQSVNQSLALE
jgi:hypothetical protein